MSQFIAARPMYDWPEVRAEVDAEWARLRGLLRKADIDAPERLVRRNADMPAVPGGIRDAVGRVIAPDPATLPPDEFDTHVLWRHPKLLFAQTCWGPMGEGLAEHVVVVGQPDYSAFEGGQGEFYSSAILMRRERGRDDLRSTLPPSVLPSGPIGRTEGGNVGRRLSDHSATVPLDRLRGRRLAFNSADSMSGIIALTRDLEALGEGLDIFPDRLETGGHRNSIIAVAGNRADVCAIDCRSWALARRFEPAAKKLAVAGWTARRKGLPYIAARAMPEAIVTALREALSELRMTTRHVAGS